MDKGESRQFILNMSASVLAFMVNAGIQFIVTPIITQSIGDEAYGFITIANDFTSYANIFASVLNSVAARFISIEVHKKNYKKAGEYFNSIFIGNFIVSFILCAFGGLVISDFNKLLNVTPDLLGDVRLVFAITFFNYILSILISIFTVSTFVKNRLDMSSVRNIISYLIKLIIIVFLFLISKPKIYYIALATLVSTIYLGFSNCRISKRIMPEVRFDIRQYKPKIVIELLKSGVWMIINNLSNVFTNNLTTVLVNIYIGPIQAGFYAVARTIPNCANTLSYSIYNVFVPNFVKLYAKNDIHGLKKYSLKSMRIMAFLLCVPFIVLCIKSNSFFSLWQSYRSSEEIVQLSSLLIISVILIIIYTPVLPLSQLGLTTNKLKWQMVNNVIVSLGGLIAVFLIVVRTNYGLYGVVFSMLIIQGFKWIFFTPIYAAQVINVQRITFFKENIKIIIKEIIIAFILVLVSQFLPSNTWGTLIISIIILCIIGYLLFFMILFNNKEKKNIFLFIGNNLKRS